MPQRQRLVAYWQGSVVEAGISYAVPWANAGEVVEVVGALPDGGDPWLSTAQAAAILKVLGAVDDPTSCDWRLHLRGADRPGGAA